MLTLRTLTAFEPCFTADKRQECDQCTYTCGYNYRVMCICKYKKMSQRYVYCIME